MKNLVSAIRIATVFATAVLCSFAAARPSFASPPVVKSATVPNLQSAYNMENDAHARYVAFAQKADREGYGEVASLFRAAARSEEVLMRDHAEVLRTLGGEQHVNVKMPVVLSTKKNLESAEAQSAGGEQDMMYSMFIVEARGEGAEDAVRTFRYAVSATAQQAILFRDAIRNLPMMRGASHIYYVCGACGAISDLPGGEMCPVCMSHEDPYEHIS